MTFKGLKGEKQSLPGLHITSVKWTNVDWRSLSEMFHQSPDAIPKFTSSNSAMAPHILLLISLELFKLNYLH